MNAKYIWQSSDAVCFDVDSTVCTGEGIDDLAEFCGVGKEVSDLYVQNGDFFLAFQFCGLLFLSALPSCSRKAKTV